jgi:hypothetical protein
MISAAIALIFSTACNQSTNKKPVAETTINIRSNGTSIEIRQAGKVEINDGETGFKNISPGGYLTYTSNNQKLTVREKDDKIEYELSDGNSQLNAGDEKGKNFVAERIRDMILAGFDAKGSVERLDKRGGSKAILDQIGNLQSDQAKSIYFDYLFSKDSLPADQFNQALQLASAIEINHVKAAVLKTLIKGRVETEQQWASLIDASTQVSPDFEKSNLLLSIAERMPRTETLKTAYLNAAKTIKSGMEYDKTKKAVM